MSIFPGAPVEGEEFTAGLAPYQTIYIYDGTHNTWNIKPGGAGGSGLSGTTNSLVRFLTGSTGGDAQITDDGTNVRVDSTGSVVITRHPRDSTGSVALEVEKYGNAGAWVRLALDSVGSATLNSYQDALTLRADGTGRIQLKAVDGHITIAPLTGGVGIGPGFDPQYQRVPLAMLEVQNSGLISSTADATMSVKNTSLAHLDMLVTKDTQDGTANLVAYAAALNSSSTAVFLIKSEGGDWNRDAAIAFYTYNQSDGYSGERMRITADKKVGILNPSPTYDLDTSGTIRATADVRANRFVLSTGVIDNNSNTFRFLGDSSKQVRFESTNESIVIQSNNRDTYMYTVDGEIDIHGSSGANSDGKLLLGSDSTVYVHAPKVKVTTLNSYTDNATALSGLGAINYLYLNGDNVCITHT